MNGAKFVRGGVTGPGSADNTIGGVVNPLGVAKALGTGFPR
jgi:hypothetical protein